MFDAFGVDPETFTHPTVWAIAGGLALATGFGHRAYRFGRDVLGPRVG